MELLVVIGIIAFLMQYTANAGTTALGNSAPPVPNHVPAMRDSAGLDRCASTGQNQAGSFGGPHDGVVMAMCDGADRVVDFKGDPAVFMRLVRGRNSGCVDLLV